MQLQNSSSKIILLSIFLFSIYLNANSSLLSYAKGAEFFDIDRVTLEKIYTAKNLQNGTLEYSIQDTLLRQYELKPLNFKNLEISSLSTKETDKYIVSIWFSYPSLSILSFYNKTTQDLEKVRILTNMKVYDATSDIKNILGIQDLVVGIYDFNQESFSTLTQTITDEYFHRIFYSPKETYIVTILGEPQYTRVKIFETASHKVVFSKDYFDQWFFPDVEIVFTEDEKELSIQVGIVNNEQKSSFKTYSTTSFKEVPPSQ